MFRSSQVLNSLHHHHGCRLASGFASLVGFCSTNAVKIPWQGTNMYTLYQSYNVDISTLFVTGRETFQAGIPASSLELDFCFFQALPPLPFSAPSWECHFSAKNSKAEIFQGFFPTLDPRYVDKWGRKFGCIVYLIIEALFFLRRFNVLCFFFPGICWVS